MSHTRANYIERYGLAVHVVGHAIDQLEAVSAIVRDVRGVEIKEVRDAHNAAEKARRVLRSILRDFEDNA